MKPLVKKTQYGRWVAVCPPCAFIRSWPTHDDAVRSADQHGRQIGHWWRAEFLQPPTQGELRRLA